MTAAKRQAREMGFNTLYLFTFDKTLPSWYQRLCWQESGQDSFNNFPVTVMQIQL
ncbi:hypothetical protein [Candidatus Paracaedibacter symbiosus]|uniref:hypothetical protein n=1 Tax=Candidatus Paracaedibacter symbiosus TaxID=244582 RepID=UPI0012EC5741|nr:hypothetical protein [Candidatus Paracaedibacter symbiosus]